MWLAQLSERFVSVLRRNPNLTAGFIFLMTLIICFDDLVFGEAALKWDAYRLWFPWKHFITNELLNGDLPLWNPFHLGGFPQHADSMTWYPVSWILGFLTGGYSLYTLNLEFLLHLFIAGFGFYKLLQAQRVNWLFSILLAMSYMLSGFMIGNAQHLGWIVSAAWLPWLALYLSLLMNQPNTLHMIIFSVIGYLFFAGGYLAIFFITLYFILFYVLNALIRQHRYRMKRLPFVSGALLIIIFLSSPILYSLYELSPVLDRVSPEVMGDQFNVNYGATPINGVLAMLLPFASGIFNVSEIDFGTFSTYLGVIPLVLLVVRLKYLFNNRKYIFLLLMALFCLVASLGDLTPIREWLSYMPLLDLFRYPTIFRLFTIFLLLMLVGYLYRDVEMTIVFNRLIANKRFAALLGTLFLIAGVIVTILHFGDGVFTLQFFTNPSYHLGVLTEHQRMIFSCSVLFFMLSVFVFGFSFLRNYRFHWVGIIWFVELIIVSHVSTFSVVNEPVSIAASNDRLAAQPFSFTKFDVSQPRAEDSNWSSFLDFMWEGKSILLKQPSLTGFSPIKLKETNQKNAPGLLDSLKVGFFARVKVENNTIVPVPFDDKLVVNGTSNWLIEPSKPLSASAYFLIKQRKVDGWQFDSSNLSAIDYRSTREGFMLIRWDDMRSVKLYYESSILAVLFIVSVVVFLILLVILFMNCLTRRAKILNLIVLIFASILLLMNNRHRWFPQTLSERPKNVLFSGQDYAGLSKLIDADQENVYVARNSPKSDPFLDVLNYFYERGNDINANKPLIAYTKRGKNREVLVSHSGEDFENNGYQLDLSALKEKGVIQNRVFVVVEFDSQISGEASFWLNHSKNGQWIKGNKWDLNEYIKHNGTNVLIRSIDLNRFPTDDGSSLKLYITGTDDSDSIKINQIQLLSY